MGLLTALAVAMHNLPEGLATFIGAVSSPVAGVAIALAIALHNVPEVGVLRCGWLRLGCAADWGYLRRTGYQNSALLVEKLHSQWQN